MIVMIKMSEKEARKINLATLNKVDLLLSQLKEGDVLFLSQYTAIQSIPLYVQRKWKLTKVVRARNSRIGLLFHKPKHAVLEGVFLGGKTMSDSSVDSYAVRYEPSSQAVYSLLHFFIDSCDHLLDADLNCVNLRTCRPSERKQTFQTLDQLREEMGGEKIGSRRSYLARVRYLEAKVLFE